MVATSCYFKGTRVNGLAIRCGEIPPAYSQLAPSQAQAPLQLADRMVYSFFAETTNAPGATSYFYMDHSQPMLTFIPDLCLTLKDSRNVRVKCGFTGGRTYRQPANLDDVVRKHPLKDSGEFEELFDNQFHESCEPNQGQGK